MGLDVVQVRFPPPPPPISETYDVIFNSSAGPARPHSARRRTGAGVGRTQDKTAERLAASLGSIIVSSEHLESDDRVSEK